MANRAQLQQVAADAIKGYESAETPEQKQQYLQVFEEVEAKLNALPPEPKDKGSTQGIISSPLVEDVVSLGKGTASTVLGVANDLGLGINRVFTGLASLPYELPALAEAAVYEAADYAGLDIGDPALEQGKFFNYLADNYTSANQQAMLSESLASLGESAAVASVAGPMSLVQRAGVATAELLRQTLGDSVRVYGPDTKGAQNVASVLEMMPLSPAELGRTSLTRGRPITPEEARVIAEENAEARRAVNNKQQQTQDKAAIDQARASEQGYSLTQGQAGADTVTIGIENSLATMPEGGVLVEVSAQNAQNFANWVQKSFVDLSNIIKPEQLRASLDNAYKAYRAKAQQDFKTKTQQAFANVGDDLAFDTQPLLDFINSKITELEDVPSITPEIKNIVKGLENLKGRLGTGDPVIEYKVIEKNGIKRRVPVVTDRINITGSRQLTAQEMQLFMADVGKMAFEGTIPAFAGVDAGFTRGFAKQLGSELQRTLDVAASGGSQSAQALKEARATYAQALGDMKAMGSLPFIKLLDKPIESIGDAELASAFQQLDTNGKAIALTILNNAGPDVVNTLRNNVLKDAFASARKEVAGKSGNAPVETYDLGKLQELLETMKDNPLFQDPKSIAGLASFEKNHKWIVERIRASELVPNKDLPSRTQLQRSMRTLTEVMGVIAGTQGRYASQVAERLAEVTEEVLRDPQAMARAAVEPAVPAIVKKALENKRISKEEAKKLDAWARGYQAQLAADIGQDDSEEE